MAQIIEAENISSSIQFHSHFNEKCLPVHEINNFRDKKLKLDKCKNYYDEIKDIEKDIIKSELDKKNIENELKNFAEIQDKQLKEVYKKNPNLRLIDGRNFNKIYDLVNNKIDNTQIESLNKFLTNKKLNDKKNPKPNINSNKNDINNFEDKLEENLNIMYETCNNYIEQLYKDQNLILKKIYNNKCKNKDLKEIQSSYYQIKYLVI